MTKKTMQELIEEGCVINRNMWIGDGWMYCIVCKEYTFHFAMSHENESDCILICEKCKVWTE